MEEIIMKEKTRKIVAGTTALSLVSALAISGTLAYLTKRTEKRANNFTFASTALNANLTEPEWDGVVDYVYDESKDIEFPVYGYEDGKLIYGYDTDDKPIFDKTQITDPFNIEKNRKKKDDKGETIAYGDKTSKDMVPGQVALKNPIITNTGDVSDEWVAAKISFVYATGDKEGTLLDTEDMKTVTDAIEIDFNADSSDAKWDRQTGLSTSNVQVFYYKEILKKDPLPNDITEHGGKTVPLFTQVRVKDSATTDQMKDLENMNGFVIYIEGFAVQNSIMETYDATTMRGYVTFETTNKNEDKKNVKEPGIISAFKSGLVPKSDPAPAPTPDPTPDQNPEQTPEENTPSEE